MTALPGTGVIYGNYFRGSPDEELRGNLLSAGGRKQRECSRL